MLFFNTMKIYTAHIKPTKKSPYEDVQFIPEGFNPFSLVFGFWWLLYYGLYLHAIGVLVVVYGVVVPSVIWLDANPFLYTFVQLVMGLILGFEGNDLRRYALKKRGYIVADIVTGSNAVAAEQRFFDRHASHILATHPI